jgi:hypothetical protein
MNVRFVVAETATMDVKRNGGGGKTDPDAVES